MFHGTEWVSEWVSKQSSEREFSVHNFYLMFKWHSFFFYSFDLDRYAFKSTHVTNKNLASEWNMSALDSSLNSLRETSFACIKQCMHCWRCYSFALLLCFVCLIMFFYRFVCIIFYYDMHKWDMQLIFLLLLKYVRLLCVSLEKFLYIKWDFNRYWLYQSDTYWSEVEVTTLIHDLWLFKKFVIIGKMVVRTFVTFTFIFKLNIYLAHDTIHSLFPFLFQFLHTNIARAKHIVSKNNQFAKIIHLNWFCLARKALLGKKCQLMVEND